MKRARPVLTILMIAACFYVCDVVSANEITIISQTDSSLELELLLKTYEVSGVGGEKFKTLKAEGFNTINPSDVPGVIVKGVMIELPPECQVRLEVSTFDSLCIEHTILAPSPRKILRENDSGDMIVEQQFVRDNSLYETDEFYPAKLADIEFTGALRNRRIAKLNIYPVQYNPVSEVLKIHKKIRIRVVFDNSSCSTINNDSDLSVLMRKSSMYEKVYEACLLNYNQFGGFKSLINNNRSKVLSAGLWPEEIQKSSFAVKATVLEEGIYKITYDDMIALGIDLSGVTNENLAVSNLGSEIAAYCSGAGSFKSGDYLLFYGETIKTLYTKKNIYWIYQKAEDAKRMEERDGSIIGGYAVLDVFKNTLHAEEDNVYWHNIPPYEDGIDHWFWEKLSTIEEPLSLEFQVVLNNLNKNSGEYSLKSTIRGETSTSQNPDHHTKIYVNNNLVDDFTWDGQIQQIRETENIPVSYFIEGQNTITVEAVDDTGAIVDSYYINNFEIEYFNDIVAENNYLKFHIDKTGGTGFNVKGFTDSDLYVYDITDPENVVRMVNYTVSSTSGYAISFEDTLSESKTYSAAGISALKKPSVLVSDEFSNLSSERDGVDYIIITHESFYDDIQSLKDYRESKGLNVEVVKVQDIYDEFSYGLKDAAAIRDFLAYAYANWHKTDHPTYVLLVGDATLDYRDDLGYFAEGKEDFLPTYIYQTNTLGNTPTDNWFVCVDGADYLPDMIIGRFCVRTEADVKNITEKIEKYEQGDMSIWAGNVVLAADDESLFENMSNTLETLLPDGFSASKVYISQYEDIQSATDDLVNKINAGSVITTYTGHGHISEWASEYLFHTPDLKGNTRNDVDLLDNGNRLTFVIAFNCMTGYFASFSGDAVYSMSEEFVRAKGKGAIACLAPTGVGYPSEHKVLAENIFNDFFKNEITTIGPLITGAKIKAYNEIASREIVETFTLFGDPATELKLLDADAIGEFVLYEPANGDMLLKRPRTVFTWGKGLYEKFRLQYSWEATFTPESTMTVPFLPFITVSDDQYRPNSLVWAILRRMSSQNGLIYWRVLAYDNDFNVLADTDYSSFSIE